MFLAYYAAYTAWLVLQAQQHTSLPAFSGIIFGLRDAAHGDHRRSQHRAQQRQARIGGAIGCVLPRMPGRLIATGVAPGGSRRRPGPDVGRRQS